MNEMGTIMTIRSNSSEDEDFPRRARENQTRLRHALKPDYDFIVCGAGASGSVVGRRLAEDPDVQVLLVEAGGSDDVDSVLDPSRWPTNLSSDRDWGFQAQPNRHLNDRALSMSMGKVLGGGSSINVTVWARGHRSDWDFIAAETADHGWGYESVLDIYRQIENWRGAPDPRYRGTGGPVWVEPAADPSPIALAMVEAAAELRIPTFESPNGRMMEGPGGAAISDLLIRNGRRHSLFRAYVRPWLDRPNPTVLTDTVVRRVSFDGRRATGVELLRDGRVETIRARREVVLSMGAIQTPKVLMHSGIGDESELRRFSIPMVQHLPGVGRNLQDHVAFGCTWEYREPLGPRNKGSEATLYWRSRTDLDVPDLLFCQVEFPVPSDKTAALGVPEHGWTMFAGLARPASRGRLRLQSTDPLAPLGIDANMMSDPADHGDGSGLRRSVPCAGQRIGVQGLGARRIHARRSRRRGAQELHPECGRDLLAPDLYRSDGAWRDVCRGRVAQGLRRRGTAHCRWVGPAARLHREHAGTLRHHR